MKTLGEGIHAQFLHTTCSQDALHILVHEGFDPQIARTLVDRLVLNGRLQYTISYMGQLILEFTYEPVYQDMKVVGYYIKYETR